MSHRSLSPAPVERWLREQHADLAVDRLLTAAGDAFRELGVNRARMEDIAARAACSRGTVYRYFRNRDELRQAYVNREALRLADRVADHVSGCEDPADLLVEGVAFALEQVRADPALIAWFDPEAAGSTAVLAGRSEVIFALAAGFVDRLLRLAAQRGRLRRGLDRDGAVEWIVRIILSLLAVPGPVRRDRDAEVAYLREFLVPALLPTPR